jgi:alkylation response protein AidB-like acyl-CoA dehydrogenase
MRAAREWEAGGPDAQKLSSMAKLFATSMLQRVTDQALQIHGGIGYWEPHPIERIYRDARAQRFEEGTNEIQKTVIAREIFSAARGRNR